nr:hypothetical protein [Bradyrhizobium sp. ORS 375]
MQRLEIITRIFEDLAIQSDTKLMTPAASLFNSSLMPEFSKDELKHLAAKARISEKLVLDAAAATVGRFKEIWQIFL